MNIVYKEHENCLCLFCLFEPTKVLRKMPNSKTDRKSKMKMLCL